MSAFRAFVGAFRFLVNLLAGTLLAVVVVLIAFMVAGSTGAFKKWAPQLDCLFSRTKSVRMDTISGGNWIRVIRMDEKCHCDTVMFFKFIPKPETKPKINKYNKWPTDVSIDTLYLYSREPQFFNRYNDRRLKTLDSMFKKHKTTLFR